MIYNLTALSQNSTNAATFLASTSNQLMGGWLGPLLLMAVFLICLIAFVQTTGDTPRAVLASSVIAMMLAIMMRAISLVSDIVVFVAIMAAAFSIAFTWRNR